MEFNKVVDAIGESFQHAAKVRVEMMISCDCTFSNLVLSVLKIRFNIGLATKVFSQFSARSQNAVHDVQQVVFRLAVAEPKPDGFQRFGFDMGNTILSSPNLNLPR